MLFWETLNKPKDRRVVDPNPGQSPTFRPQRLPYDKRCVAITKSGVRCRGRIREETDYCPFHDPALTPERRRRIAAKGGRKHRRLSHLPDGYLRKLHSRAAVGDAMDRLYREVRLGVISTEMGTVLFEILTRLLDSGLIEPGKCPERSQAARIKPKLSELLTRQEREAWRKAVGKARDSSLRATPVHEAGAPFKRAVTQRQETQPAKGGTTKRPLQAAS